MRYLALVLVLALPQPAWSGQSAKAWLDKMAGAVESLNYKGTFIFLHGDKIETMHIVHGHAKGGVRERLYSVTGEAREVIRNRNVLTCVWPRKHLVVVETARARHGLPATIPTDTSALSDYYRFTVAAEDRIAGRSCRIITIAPKDDLRYGHRLCVANKSGMLLKSIILDTSGKPIEQVMFTNLELRQSSAELRFQPTMIGKGYHWRKVTTNDRSVKQKPDPGWEIDSMPPGFKITSNAKRAIAASPRPVQHIILTDGLASVSVFIAKPQGSQAFLEGTTENGALHAFARGLDSKYQITVVGEVPAKTVKLIGQSVTYQYHAQK